MKVIAKGLKPLLKQAILAAQPKPANEVWRISAEELEGVEVRWPTSVAYPPQRIYMEPLFYGIKARVPVKLTDIPQHGESIVVIEFCRAGRTYRVGINCRDYPDVVHLDKAEGGPGSLDLEFKMQYRLGGYGVANIIPGAFVPGAVLVDCYARGPMRERRRQRFSYDVYGRFSLEWARDVRAAAIAKLGNQSRVSFLGGARKVSYREFLREIAQARVCLDLPGNGPFCFRLVNYLAIGACVVSAPQAAVMPVPFVDRKHIVFARPDLSDLVDLCAQYAQDASAREAVAQAGRDYYLQHLHWRSLSNYYLRMMLDRLP
jgi:Glycosyl transferases group 1